MQSLYKQDYTYGSATHLSEETYKALKPIFDKWRSVGFSPREISHVMVIAAIELEADEMLARLTTPQEPRSN